MPKKQPPQFAIHQAARYSVAGYQISDAKWRSLYGKWNQWLQQHFAFQCDFIRGKGKSGCHLPFCPECALRARYRFGVGVYEAAAVAEEQGARVDSLQVATMQIHAISTDVLAFQWLYDPQLSRRFTCADSESWRSLGWLIGAGYENRTWDFTRVGVLIHRKPGTVATRCRRPRQPRKGVSIDFERARDVIDRAVWSGVTWLPNTIQAPVTSARWAASYLIPYAFDAVGPVRKLMESHLSKGMADIIREVYLSGGRRKAYFSRYSNVKSLGDETVE